MEAIATANDYGVLYDYGCIDGMNGEYPASESQADWHKETFSLWLEALYGQY
jgi:hypothetical protein